MVVVAVVAVVVVVVYGPHTMAILVASLFFPKMYPAKPFPKMRVEVGSVLTTGMAGPGGG